MSTRTLKPLKRCTSNRDRISARRDAVPNRNGSQSHQHVHAQQSVVTTRTANAPNRGGAESVPSSTGALACLYVTDLHEFPPTAPTEAGVIPAPLAFNASCGVAYVATRAASPVVFATFLTLSNGQLHKTGRVASIRCRRHVPDPSGRIVVFSTLARRCC